MQWSKKRVRQPNRVTFEFISIDYETDGFDKFAYRKGS